MSARRLLTLAATLATGASGPAYAALDEAALLAQLKSMAQRLQLVEERNPAMERRLAATPAVPLAPNPDERLRKLERAQADTDRALGSERLSEAEPELVTRLKAVEYQALSMQKQTRQIEALEGITVSAAVVSMLQHAGKDGGAEGQAQTRLNYRGDVALTLPGGGFGNAEGQIFTQLRFGQGSGVALRTTFTATPNTTTFEVGGVADPDSSFAVLGQLWYQLSVPLPLDGFKPHSKRQLQLNAGKLDPFVFFDQNSIADDETTRFVNNVFVHNPLLDSGGDAGMDAYGFTPGLRLAYLDDSDPSWPWAASIGVFGSGPATNFSGSLGRPFAIAQVEVAPRLLGGLAGNYRLYAWHNGRAGAIDGREEAHAGWGLSVDQRVTESARLFGRYGQRLRGHGGFDRALTLGAEVAGERWQRAADAFGLAVAWLPASAAWRDATADGTLIGARASGTERVVELYYRWRLGAQLELSPDLQWIGRPAAHPQASSFWAVGLRARLGF
jgi:hypothetical protein